MSNINEILKRYDLNAIFDVVDDRLRDYAEHVEAEYEGDEFDTYPIGYGDALRQAVQLLGELKNLK